MCRFALINSVQTRCIVKGEAQKSPLFWRFSGGLWFSQARLFSRNSTRKPLNLIKSPDFYNAPCKTACLYNAPSMHTVDLISVLKGICTFSVPEKNAPPEAVPSGSLPSTLLFLYLEDAHHNSSKRAAAAAAAAAAAEALPPKVTVVEQNPAL